MENRDNAVLNAGCAVKLDTSFGHEGGGDFSLPDYLPEIQRLLALHASVLPETSFLSGNVLEIGGTLSYDVIYSDADGKTVCASLITDYSADTALSQNIDNVGELFISTEEEGTTCRVTSPRGVNIKTRMKTRVVSDEYVVTDGALTRRGGTRASDEEMSSVERLTSSVVSVARGHAVSTGNVTGEISAREKDDTVVFCRGSLCVSNALCAEKAVKAEGEIYIDCIFNGTDGLYTKCARYPFEIEIITEGADSNCLARAWGRVASVGVTPNGDSTNYAVSVEYDIEAEYMCRRENEVCFDAYSTEYECSGEVGECDLTVPISFGTAKIPLANSAEIHSDNPREVLCLIPFSKTLQTAASPEGINIVGSVKVKALVLGDEVSCTEVDLPVRYKLDPADVSDLQSFVTCCPFGLSGKISGNTVEVSGEALLTWSVSGKRKLHYIKSVILGEALEGGGELTVKAYYPQSEESLWSICKKYAADIRRIKEANPDVGDTVPKGFPVIIY